MATSSMRIRYHALYSRMMLVLGGHSLDVHMPILDVYNCHGSSNIEVLQTFVSAVLGCCTAAVDCIAGTAVGAAVVAFVRAAAVPY